MGHAHTGLPHGGLAVRRTRFDEHPCPIARTADLFLELAGEHTLIVVEHDMDFVNRIARTVTVLHEGAVLRLGPKTISGVEAQADRVTVSGQVISIFGWWDSGCGFMNFPHYSIVDVPHLAPGVYTVNFNVVGFPGPDQFTRTLVVAGGGAQAPVPVPAVSGYSLAAGILGVLILVGWTLRRDRPRRVG